MCGALVAGMEDISNALSNSAHARVVLSGLLDDQAGMVADAYDVHDLHVSNQLSRSGWATLILQR